ncbi:hypothetical protein BDZ94DRAFT_1238727 [Collybia nuda]|uniref:Uncharacterized protein n=1 Tax=Collybia nuda TaxID=64659 RepID=A0A9P5Y2I8_9AGAR|nr:hypothetical protein BDZ94DRAFT_1238727 [Collybia nuda]
MFATLCMRQSRTKRQSQGRDSSPASPADLAAFYKDMEQKEIVERKLSKRRSNSGTSIWSRKSVKRSATAPPAPPPIQKSLSKQHPHDLEKRRKEAEEEREAERLEESIEKPDWVPPMNSPRSIIPETMKELPVWYNKDTWASVPLPSFKLRYNLHNPVGPRWYKNHHLIPPSQVRSTARPPTVFSPSFPPITSSTGHERSEDGTKVAGPSRTSSNSPLATPSSSQTRVVDGNKPRSRKTSETAHDNVDLLDVTDPWGTNWHHHSPYDIGLGNEPVSVDVQNLSKRRTPALGNIFGGHVQEPARNAVSLPATPVDHVPYSMENFHPSQLPKRMSVAPLGSTSAIQPHEPTPKKEKRGSVLGRLVKKFSIMRKSPGALGGENDWQRVNSDKGQYLDTLEPPVAPEKPQSVISKRVPPPSIDAVASAKLNDKPRDLDRSSSISLEAPFSMGRLTIANPDAPGSADTTPAFNEASLPLESRPHDSYVSTYLAYNDALERDSQTLLSPKSRTDSPLNVPSQSPKNPLPLLSTTNDMTKDSSKITPIRNSKAPQSPEPQSPVIEFNLKVPLRQPSAPPSNYSDSPSTSDSRIPGPPTERSMSFSPQTVTSHQLPSSPESRTSHTSDTIQGVRATQSKANPLSFSPSVPFPTIQPTNGHYLAPEEHYSYDHSPLSAASMLANPPTPYADDMSIPATPELSPPALPSKFDEKKLVSSESSSGNPAMGRQTETFKLIRSSSGNVFASSETIVAGGQQWEVVESMDSKGKGKGKGSSKPKDPETNSRREQGREVKVKASRDIETEPRNRSQRRSQRQQSGEQSEPMDIGLSAGRTSNDLHHQKTDIGSPEMRYSATRSSRKRDEDRKLDRKGEKLSVPVNVNKPQPAPPPPTPGAPPRPLQRNPSISARPTSELPSAAEMNALRAKEAWEMERLWKARTPTSDSSLKLGDTRDAMHGSSHTAFVVQTPFQDYLTSDRKSLASSLRPALANPLPEPPRESSYEPAPISLDIGNKPTDYWTKYTGLATSH